MHHYLVTFYLNNSQSLDTVMSGSSLEDVKRQLFESFRAPDPAAVHFSKRNTTDVAFTVVYENISAITYELLFIQPRVSFHALCAEPADTLQLLAARLPNPFVLAVALMGLSAAEKKQILHFLGAPWQQTVAQIEAIGLGRIRTQDVQAAQHELIELALELHESRVLSLSALSASAPSGE